MTISDFELYKFLVQWLFLPLETNDGLVGWGEPAVEGRAKTVQTAVKELLDNYLPGTDPADVEDHWQAIYSGSFDRGGLALMSTIAGIDQALWDIKDKQFGAPVHATVGRGRMRSDASLPVDRRDRPADIAEQAREKVVDGFTTLKMNTTPNSAASKPRRRSKQWASGSGSSARPSVTRSSSVWTFTAGSTSQWPNASSRRSNRTHPSSSKSQSCRHRTMLCHTLPSTRRHRLRRAGECTRPGNTNRSSSRGLST